jgi:hypothetical protein
MEPGEWRGNVEREMEKGDEGKRWKRIGKMETKGKGEGKKKETKRREEVEGP